MNHMLKNLKELSWHGFQHKWGRLHICTNPKVEGGTKFTYFVMNNQADWWRVKPKEKIVIRAVSCLISFDFIHCFPKTRVYFTFPTIKSI